MLGMLDPPTAISRSSISDDPFHDIQDDVIGFVSNGVDGDLEL